MGSLCVVLLLLLAVKVNGQEPAKVLSFGVVPQQSATVLARNWVPFLNEVARRTQLSIRFATAPNIPTFEKRLADGLYDIAYMNPYHYTVFHRQPGYEAIARARDRRLKGILVVRADSPISDLKQLSGQTLAFPAPAAFAASVLVRAQFSRDAIEITPKYVSSHDSVYRSVAAGLYPAGGGVIRTFNKVDAEIRDELRILWTTQGFTPHAIAVHPRVTTAQRKAVTSAMTGLEDDVQGRSLLKALGFTGVTPAANADWDDVRALGLDLLDSLIKN